MELDQAVEAEIRLRSRTSTPLLQDVLDEASTLFRRRAFGPIIDADRFEEWGLALFAIVKTRLVWEQAIEPHIYDKTKASRVNAALDDLINWHCGTVFDISRSRLDSIWSQHGSRKEDFRRSLPPWMLPANAALEEREAKRLQLKLALDAVGIRDVLPHAGTPGGLQL